MSNKLLSMEEYDIYCIESGIGLMSHRSEKRVQCAEEANDMRYF